MSEAKTAVHDLEVNDRLPLSDNPPKKQLLIDIDALRNSSQVTVDDDQGLKTTICNDVTIDTYVPLPFPAQ